FNPRRAQAFDLSAQFPIASGKETRSEPLFSEVSRHAAVGGGQKGRIPPWHYRLELGQVKMGAERTARKVLDLCSRVPERWPVRHHRGGRYPLPRHQIENSVVNRFADAQVVGVDDHTLNVHAGATAGVASSNTSLATRSHERERPQLDISEWSHARVS